MDSANIVKIFVRWSRGGPLPAPYPEKSDWVLPFSRNGNYDQQSPAGIGTVTSSVPAPQIPTETVGFINVLIVFYSMNP
jgi:hypothetical protein